ncbi:MAG TPA: hypothetical protein VD963_08900 [Phycisphaerales bacterium]|nr:hypothetical protein [Phycisphaerales bacterium]
MKTTAAWALMVSTGLAASVYGQDSVSPGQGIANSDAVWAWRTSEQHNAFVVDLAPLLTDWGHTFGIAPLYKSSRSDAAFPSTLLSLQSLSSMTVGPEPAAPLPSYQLWTFPGGGINDLKSLATDTFVPGPGTYYGFGAAFREASGNYDGLVGGIVAYSAALPERLLVSRTHAAINSTASFDPVSENYTIFSWGSRFGGPTIDASRNLSFRADGSSPPAIAVNPLAGNNIFRVDLQARNTGMTNFFDNAGPSDLGATSWLVVRHASNHNPPTGIPEERGLGVTRPVMMTENFQTNYVFESSPGVTFATAMHRPGTDDHRGVPSYSPAVFFPGTVGTGATLSRPTGLLSMRTRGISLFGVDTNGSPMGTQLLRFDLAASVSDPITGFVATFGTPPNGFGLGEFMHYRSQTAFQGGAQVAVGMDQSGRLLVAATAADSFGSSFGSNGTEHDMASPFNYLVAARVPAPGAAPEWSLAAYVTATDGKIIVDENGVRTGQLVPLGSVSGAPIGPSISSPAIDSVGNIWFLAAYQNQDPNGAPLGQPTTGLFRAIYDGTLAVPGYRLELVLSNGQVLRGKNADRDYKIVFLSIADNDSISSGSLFAHNINQGTYAGFPLGNASTADPRTLGGLVIQATIIYDVNADGQFERLSGAGGNPNSPDQDYNVVLFLGGTTFEDDTVDCNGNGIDDAQEIAGSPAMDCFDPAAGTLNGFHQVGGPNGAIDACECPANFNRDAAVGTSDISAFLSSWFNDITTGQTKADINCSGSIGTNDVSTFLSIWFAALNGQPAFNNCP